MPPGGSPPLWLSGAARVHSPTRLIGDAREGRPVPHVGLPAKTAGPWRAWEAGCPVRARAEITGKYAGEVREGVRGRTRGGCRRGVWQRDRKSVV